MSLYLKYRPADFDEIKGNQEIVATLTSMLKDKETCPHSFLLQGPTGCGKTTLARIIANKLECAEGDLTEVNSADIRGIDGVRDIIKQSRFMPMSGPCKVWIIDEAHKQTSEAQNAFLKILEDTPSHVYFILCTTEPQKLITTIKGRCSTFQVKQLTETEMFRLLRGIAKEEGVVIEKDIFDQIIQDCEGHPRNAINILEQVLNTEPEQRLEVARRYAEKQSQIIELCRVLTRPNPRATWKEVIAILNGLKEEDPESIRRVVLGYCQAILLKSEHNLAAGVLEAFMEPNFTNGRPQLVFAAYTVVKRT